MAGLRTSGIRLAEGDPADTGPGSACHPKRDLVVGKGVAPGTLEAS